MIVDGMLRCSYLLQNGLRYSYGDDLAKPSAGTKKKSKMHPLVKGIVVLTVGPFVMAAAMVVAAGSVVYGAGQIIVGIGDLMMMGPLRKKAINAWKHRNDHGEEAV